MRSYDLADIIEGEYFVVKMKDRLEGNDQEFSDKMKMMEVWGDMHCDGAYIILLESFVVELEADALILKLKYG